VGHVTVEGEGVGAWAEAVVATVQRTIVIVVIITALQPLAGAHFRKVKTPCSLLKKTQTID